MSKLSDMLDKWLNEPKVSKPTSAIPLLKGEIEASMRPSDMELADLSTALIEANGAGMAKVERMPGGTTKITVFVAQPDATRCAAAYATTVAELEGTLSP